MLLLHKKRHGINFYTVWFAKEPLRKSGIISYYECVNDIKGDKKIEFETLVTDLRESEDEIRQHFSKSCKYKVKRAAREDVEVRIYSGIEITDQMIEEFCDFFMLFWESKGSVLEDRNKIKQELYDYRKAGALSIGYAVVQGEKAVYHTHIGDETMVRLLHSASLYRLQRDEEGNTKNLIGMANRYLHFEEMKYFKNQGKVCYDWGGAGHGEDVIHITEFKESFGGLPVTYYHYEHVNGILAKAFRMLIKLLGK